MAPLLIAIPAGPVTLSEFQSRWWTLKTPPGGYRVIEGIGPYVAMNMRNIVAQALRDPSWERLLVFENDMIAEPDMLIRHAAHTAPVVGSVYTQHYPPFDLNCTLPTATGLHRRLLASEVRDQVVWADPWLMPVKSVGLGCTSIARSVFEHWPTDRPFFRNEWTGQPHIQANAAGEISHDAWFCEQLEAQGIPIVMDTGIRLRQLTVTKVGLVDHSRYHGYALARPRAEVGDVEEVSLPRRS